MYLLELVGWGIDHERLAGCSHEFNPGREPIFSS